MHSLNLRKHAQQRMPSVADIVWYSKEGYYTPLELIEDLLAVEHEFLKDNFVFTMNQLYVPRRIFRNASEAWEFVEENLTQHGDAIVLLETYLEFPSAREEAAKLISRQIRSDWKNMDPIDLRWEIEYRILYEELFGVPIEQDAFYDEAYYPEIDVEDIEP